MYVEPVMHTIPKPLLGNIHDEIFPLSGKAQSLHKAQVDSVAN